MNEHLEQLGQKPDLVIRLNTNPIPNDCPLCGVETNPNIGAEVFLSETDKVVCFQCASYHAPILAGLMAFQDLARTQQTNEESFGLKWQAENNHFKSPLNTYQSFGVQAEGKNAA